MNELIAKVVRITHAASCIAALLATESFVDLMTVVAGVVTCAIAFELAFARTTSRVVLSLVLWLHVTFTVRLPFCLWLPEHSYLGLISPYNGPATVCCRSYFYFSIGFLCVVVAALIARPKNAAPTNSGPAALSDQQLQMLTMVAVFFAGCKALAGYLQTGFNQHNVEIPLLYGAIVYVGDIAAPVFCSFAFVTFLRRRSHVGAIGSLVLLAMLIAVDVRSGYKKALFLVPGAVTWAALPELMSYRFGYNRKRILAILAALAFVAVLFYKPVMEIRTQMMFKRKSASEAVYSVVSSGGLWNQDLVETSLAILQRLNGLDLFAVCVDSFGDRKLNSEFITNGRFGEYFTFKIGGHATNSTTRMGTTLWGFSVAVLGIPGILICGVALWCLASWSDHLLNYLRFPLDVRLVAEAALWVWLVKVEMGSGAIGSYSKQLAVTIGAIILIRALTKDVVSVHDLSSQGTGAVA